MTRMEKVKHYSYKLEHWIASICLVGILIAPLIDVVERNLRVSIIGVGTELQEIVIYLFIYFTYVGISIAVRTRAHIRTTVLLVSLPRVIREAIELFCKLMFLGFCVIMLFESVRLLMQTYKLGEKTPALDIPLCVVVIALPLGFALSCFHLIMIIVERKDLG